MKFYSVKVLVYNVPKYQATNLDTKRAENKHIRKIIDTTPNGYLSAKTTTSLLKHAGLNFVDQFEVRNKIELLHIVKSLTYPVVIKVVGILHKSDVGGVILNIKNEKELVVNFEKLIRIDDVTSVIIQPMKKGIELFIGAKKESNFSHIIMCGLGGVFVEILKDVSVKMIPISKNESLDMITNLKTYPMLKGIRGQKGIDIEKFAEIIRKIATLLSIAPEITELDINPLLASANEIIAVDARIRIEK